jgi:C4-dicarboxylate-specific signal transduction histidine kinase
LASSLNRLDLAIRSLNDTSAAAHLQMVKKEIRRVTRIVQKSLASSNQSAFSECNLATALLEVRELLQDRLDQSASLISEVPTDATLSISHDDGRHILLNLITNSIDASDDHGTIRVVWNGPYMGGVAFTVVDNGCGIPASVFEKVLEPFVSSHAQEPAVDVPRGVGLALCKNIVEQAGGRIEYGNGETRGAWFTVVVPRNEG